MTSPIYIIIPVHNRKIFTRDCLRSLEKQTVPNLHRIIIVDDGSEDGTREMLSTEFPDVMVLSGDGNLFWTAAINLGIRHALSLGAEYILTLNNDTVASETFMEQMFRSANQTPHALIGALDIDIESREPHYGGEWFDWKWSKSIYLLEQLTEGDHKGLHEVDLYPGRGLLIPQAVFEKIGLFEETRLPHYLADYDFTQMARRNGFKIFCNYDAKLYTYPEESTDRKLRHNKSLKKYFQHLFSIRGGGNLKDFTIYTMRNCPGKHMLPSLLSGYLRRIGGYWLK